MKKSPWKLDPLFTPRSIAVIGASPNGGAGSIVLRNMQRLGYTGTVYPINPKYKEIFGYPCYASLRDLPAPADCAAVLLGSRSLLPMLEEAHAAGVKGVWGFASGFAETGGEGRAMQRRIHDFCHESGLLFCGPNCVGYANITDKTCLYSAPLPQACRPGDSGVGVRTVRYYLAFLGDFLPQLPPIRLTDTFDQEMLDAVYAFQSAYGLPVDGIVGRETWNALQDAYQSTVSQLPENYQDFAEEVYPGRFLVEGDRGEEVRLMQERLRDIARAGGSIPLIAADGVFGPATREAVQALQRQLGLEETGAVGPVLWAEIMTRGQEY